LENWLNTGTLIVASRASGTTKDESRDTIDSSFANMNKKDNFQIA
jgi:hypothetical protein